MLPQDYTLDPGCTGTSLAGNRAWLAVFCLSGAPRGRKAKGTAFQWHFDYHFGTNSSVREKSRSIASYAAGQQ